MVMDKQTDRRELLTAAGMGLAGLVAALTMKENKLLANPAKPDLVGRSFDTIEKPAPKPAKAKSMISLWMQGGPSQIDLFDPKEELVKRHGETFPGDIKYDNAAQASSKILAPPWKYRHYGECGMEMSELIPHTGAIADDITLIRSMHTGVNNHGQSIRAMNSGTTAAMHPVLGSWLTYGLGGETNSLPPYVALIDPGQLPVDGVGNWHNGYLPSVYQGTVIRPTEPRILNLTPPARLEGAPQKKLLSYLQKLNQKDLQRKPGELDYQARINMYELAARMQTAVSYTHLTLPTKA